MQSSSQCVCCRSVADYLLRTTKTLFLDEATETNFFLPMSDKEEFTATKTHTEVQVNKKEITDNSSHTLTKLLIISLLSLLLEQITTVPKKLI